MDNFPTWALVPISDHGEAHGNVANFIQGGVYDDAGNKSVSHLSLDGTITFVPEGSNLSWVAPVEIPYSRNCVCGYYEKASHLYYALESMNYHAVTPKCWENGWGPFKVFYDRTRDYSVGIHGNANSGSVDFKYVYKQAYHDGDVASYTCTYEGVARVWWSEKDGSYRSGYQSTYTEEYVNRDGTTRKDTKEYKDSNQWTKRVSIKGTQTAGKPFSYLYIPTALEYDARDAMFLALNDNEAWSNLVQDCVTSAHAWDNNMLALARDIINLRADVESMCSTAKELAKNTRVLVATGEGARATTQSLASTYLGNKYGYGLTVSDCWSVGEAVSNIRKRAKSLKYGVQKLRARYQSIVTTNVGSYTVQYAYMARIAKCDSALMDLIRTAMSWDFYPTTANMWDFVPYSFVVDWLVDVGGLLETIDAGLEKAYLPVRSITKSVKMTSLQTEPKRFWGRGATGVVSISYYRRFPSYEWDPLLPILQPGSGLNGHFLESAALIIQRILGARH